jgi:uncharacterized protein YdeI (YjbR/CyaY-like superfamily)
MASFKQHATFGFWKYKLIKDPKNYLGLRSNEGGEAMGNMGKLYSIKDLPPDKYMIDFVKQASKLNETGVKLPPRVIKPKKNLVVPTYLTSALKNNKKALAQFEKFSPSAKKSTWNGSLMLRQKKRATRA